MKKFLIVFAILFSGCAKEVKDPSEPKANQGIIYTSNANEVVTVKAIGYRIGYRGVSQVAYKYFCRNLKATSLANRSEVVYKQYDVNGDLEDVKIVGHTCRFI